MPCHYYVYNETSKDCYIGDLTAAQSVISESSTAMTVHFQYSNISTSGSPLTKLNWDLLLTEQIDVIKDTKYSLCQTSLPNVEAWSYKEIVFTPAQSSGELNNACFSACFMQPSVECHATIISGARCFLGSLTTAAPLGSPSPLTAEHVCIRSGMD